MKQEIELTVFCKFPSLLTFFLIFHLSYQFCNFPFFSDICCCCRCKFPFIITSVCIVRISITIFFFCNFPSLSQLFYVVVVSFHHFFCVIFHLYHIFLNYDNHCRLYCKLPSLSHPFLSLFNNILHCKLFILIWIASVPCLNHCLPQTLLDLR